MKRAAYKEGRIDNNGKLIFHIEDRIAKNAWIAAFMYPAALLWWGWAAGKKIFWLVPVSSILI